MVQAVAVVQVVAMVQVVAVEPVMALVVKVLAGVTVVQISAVAVA